MTKKTNEVKAELNTLEAEGKALARIWSGITKGDFKNSTKANGFDTRLGKLMVSLKAEANGRISSARLKEVGIHNIAKQRRSEALWFIENEVEAREFAKASKKGFTSLSALQKAMAKAAKPVEPKGSETPEQPEPKGSDKSDVGQTTSGERSADQKTSALDIALLVLEQCELHGVELQDVLGELNPRVKSKVAA